MLKFLKNVYTQGAYLLCIFDENKNRKPRCQQKPVVDGVVDQDVQIRDDHLGVVAHECAPERVDPGVDLMNQFRPELRTTLNHG
jgi:spore germination cell wall hydrolase CwlJ-like protein